MNLKEIKVNDTPIVGVDEEPTTGSYNLVESDGVAKVDEYYFEKISKLFKYVGESVGTVANGKNAQRSGNGKVYVASGSSAYNLLRYTLNGEKYLQFTCTASSSISYGAGVIFTDDNYNILSQYNNSISGNYTVVLKVPKQSTVVYVNGLNYFIPTCVAGTLSDEVICEEELQTEIELRETNDNTILDKIQPMYKREYIEGESVGSVTNEKNVQVFNNKALIVDGSSAYNIIEYNLNGEIYLKCTYTATSDEKYGVGVAFTDSYYNVITKLNESVNGQYTRVLSVPESASKVLINGVNIVPVCKKMVSNDIPLFTEDTFKKINYLYEPDFVDIESVGTVANGKNAQRSGNGKVYVADGSSTYNLLQYTLNGEFFLKCYCTASSSINYGAGVIFTDDNYIILSQYNNPTSGNYTVILSVPEDATKVYINGIGIIPKCISQTMKDFPIYSKEIKALDENLLKTEYIDGPNLGTVENEKNAQVTSDGSYVYVSHGSQDFNVIVYNLNGEKKIRCKYSASSDEMYGVGVIFSDDMNRVIEKRNEDTSLLLTYDRIFTVPEEATKVFINGTNGFIPQCIQEISKKTFSYEYLDYISPKISLSLFENIGIIGDSYASGELYYNSNYHDKYNISWGQQIARKFGIQCVNFSSGGLSTRTWLTATRGLPKLLNDPEQDLYLFVLGINDYYHHGINYLGSIEDITNYESYEDYGDTFYGNYGKIIEQTAAHAPNAKLIMIGLAGTGDLAVTFDTAIREIADHYNIPYINQKDDSFYLEPVYANMAGGHPTAAGYARMAIAFERLICKCILDNLSYFLNFKMYD